ncbi:transporter substrate-binding domain-containing protein [Variovorax gossypii]|uniref:Transporter substrate-binding domain-containing protein n=1 Tax=Variovorax gossypii TaxID=1679495 RepID=A0A3S0IYZ0_9BURK|nr:ABC transporter substrate-binding protein [Variovorax gossypii]RTQ32958.1 transporter substrate-binding domain-containing protein [Variovorax gossypii]
MPKLLPLALPLLAGLTLSAAAAHADQLEDIKKRGTLVCGTLGIAEPFSFANPQTRETQGYDVDFCGAIARSLGVKLELKLVAVPARIPELQQGRVDVLAANLGWTAERAEQIAFSDSYYVSLTKAATRRADKFAAVNNLSGKRVATAKGSTSEAAARKAIPDVQVITYQDPPSIFLALQQGKADAAVASELVLVKWKTEVEASAPIDVLEPALLNESWGIGMRKNETALIKHVNGVLESMEKSGEAARIFDKWLGTGTPYKLKRGFQSGPIKG